VRGTRAQSCSVRAMPCHGTELWREGSNGDRGDPLPLPRTDPGRAPVVGRLEVNSGHLCVLRCGHYVGQWEACVRAVVLTAARARPCVGRSRSLSVQRSAPLPAAVSSVRSCSRGKPEPKGRGRGRGSARGSAHTSRIGRTKKLQDMSRPGQGERQCLAGSGCFLFRPGSLPHANPKYFLCHLSHRIFGCIHRALNVDKKDN
jgi:hypothetical protein